MSKTLIVRYGESADFLVKTDDEVAETATLYVGKAGHPPVISLTANFVNKEALITATPSDTRVPLGEYRWQITVHSIGGHTYKYPVPRKKPGCNDFDGLPPFIVLESLDETEAL